MKIGRVKLNIRGIFEDKGSREGADEVELVRTGRGQQNATEAFRVAALASRTRNGLLQAEDNTRILIADRSYLFLSERVYNLSTRVLVVPHCKLYTYRNNRNKLSCAIPRKTSTTRSITIKTGRFFFKVR